MGIICSDSASQVISLGREGVYSSDNSSPSIVYDHDAQLLFDQWTTPVVDGIKQIYNDFIVGCKADVSLRGNTSNWEEIKALWILMGPTRQISFLNVRYPSLTPISDVVAPTHIPFQYLVGNGTTQHVNLNWNPTTAVNTYTQDDAGIGVYCEANASGAMIAMGATNASTQGARINPRTATDIMQGAASGVNTNIGTGGTTTDSSGFKSIRRDNSTQIKTNKGLVSDSFTSTSASVAPVNLSLYGCASNANGTAATFDSRPYSFWWITSGYIDSYKLSLRIETFRS